MTRFGWTALLVLAGCGIFESSPEPAARGRRAEPFRGSTERTEVERDVPRNTLDDIELSERDGFDRIEFEFQGARLPGYTVEYVAGPGRLCESGLPSQVEGDRFLRVRFEPVRMDVEDSWRDLNMPTLAAIRDICSRGDVVTWIVGLDESTSYRILEMQDPPRIVVDVGHAAEDLRSSR